MTAGHGRRPANPARAAATVEAGADLDAWLRFCVRTLRSKGTLTMIHRADRLDAVLACLRGRVGDLRLFPLWPGGGRASKRVIIAGRKDRERRCAFCPAFACTRRMADTPRRRRRCCGEARAWRSGTSA